MKKNNSNENNSNIFKILFKITLYKLRNIIMETITNKSWKILYSLISLLSITFFFFSKDQKCQK